MIRVADGSHKNPDGSLKNTDKDKTMFLGAQAWNVFSGEKQVQDKDGNKSNSFSNHPAGSVLLDYQNPIKELSFNVGSTGKLNAFKYYSKNPKIKIILTKI